MDTFGRDALTLPASDDARRSGEWVAGPETPAVILDWHYATSPFAASVAEDRLFRADFAHKLLASRRAEHGGGDDWSPYGSAPAQARRWEAANCNRRLWVVR